MSGLPLYVWWVWGSSILAQMIVLVLLFSKKNFRKLPYFTAYATLNMCQAGFLLVIYSRSDVDLATATVLAWASECITLLAQALATIEILGITLKPYQGIWGLGWRALTFVSASVVVLVAGATRGNWASTLWFELNRGYHLTFATALAACLLLIRYYSIPVIAPYKLLLGGFCFYSCTEILINTILQHFLYKSFSTYQPIWQSATVLSFVLVQIMWMAALRKPLPVENRQLSSLSDADYQRLSPEINEHLRLLNEKLLRLWKLEARPN